MNRANRAIPGCDRGRPAVDSTCWCSTHTPSSSPAGWSPAVCSSCWPLSQGLPRWRTSRRSTSSGGWLQGGRPGLVWGVSWYLVGKTGWQMFESKCVRKRYGWVGVEGSWCLMYERTNDFEELVSHPVRGDRSEGAPCSTGSARSQRFEPQRWLH